MENNEDINLDLFDNHKEETPGQTENNKKHKKNKKKLNTALKIVVPVLAALLIIFAVTEIYLSVSPKRNPEKLLNSYISAVLDAKWEKAYKMMPLENSFISRQDFIEYCSANPQAMDFADAPISDFVIEKDKIEGSHCYFSVSYVTEAKTNGTFYITVEKTKDGVGRFDEYRVIPVSDSICTLTVYTPDKTSVTVNGTEIENHEQIVKQDVFSQKSYYYSSHQIKYILTGVYSIKAENEFFTPVETDIEIKPGESNKEIYIKQYISEDTYNKLCSITKDYILSIYNGTIANNLDYSSFPVSEEYKNSFENDMNTIINDAVYSNITLTEFSLTSSEAAKSYEDAKTELNCTGQNKMDIRINFNYDYTYEYTDDTGAAVSESKSDSGYLSIIYLLEKGNWKIDSISGKAWF